MHSVDFPPEAGKKGSFQFNSDFSGDVLITMDESDLYPEFSIPGAALESLLETMIEYKLGNIREDIAELVLRAITRP